jgi:hypothetical protein
MIFLLLMFQDHAYVDNSIGFERMRMRRVPGMPWGEDALFEYHRYVAPEWPLPEGHDGKVHAHDHH